MKKIILDCDPGHDDAIAIALEYGGPLLLCGLDVTHQFQATPERIQTVHDLPGTLEQLRMGDREDSTPIM